MLSLIIESVHLCARLSDREKAWPRVVQAYGRPPVWVRMCLVRLPDFDKVLLQVVQVLLGRLRRKKDRRSEAEERKRQSLLITRPA